MRDAASKMPPRIWAWKGVGSGWTPKRLLNEVPTKEYIRADIVERMAEALEAAAARFNLMSGIVPVNGADPKVGYREAMQALNPYREASNDKA